MGIRAVRGSYFYDVDTHSPTKPHISRQNGQQKDVAHSTQIIWLHFFGIAIDDPDKVQRLVNHLGINYPVFVGNQQPIEIATKFGNRIGVLPFTVIVNREGNIVFRQVGGMNKQKTKQVILSLL